MFITPSKVFQTFQIEQAVLGQNARGRQTASFEPVGILSGVLADIRQQSAFEQIRLQQTQHPLSHTIVSKGRPKAKQGDRLSYNGRLFYIHGTEDAGGLGLWTLYYCEERNDTAE